MSIWHWKYAKGQLISKCLFGVFNFFQKTNENKSNWGIIVVKSNSFVCFLEESLAWKNHYDFVWPLDSSIGHQIPIIYKESAQICFSGLLGTKTQQKKYLDMWFTKVNGLFSSRTVTRIAPTSNIGTNQLIINSIQKFLFCIIMDILRLRSFKNIM